jgi:hypothetical protein
MFDRRETAQAPTKFSQTRKKNKTNTGKKERNNKN